jgi:hypothetical protein
MLLLLKYDRLDKWIVLRHSDNNYQVGSLHRVFLEHLSKSQLHI